MNAIWDVPQGRHGISRAISAINKIMIVILFLFLNTRNVGQGSQGRRGLGARSKDHKIDPTIVFQCHHVILNITQRFFHAILMKNLE